MHSIFVSIAYRQVTQVPIFWYEGWPVANLFLIKEITTAALQNIL
jgi:hypothetical protein